MKHFETDRLTALCRRLLRSGSTRTTSTTAMPGPATSVSNEPSVTTVVAKAAYTVCWTEYSHPVPSVSMGRDVGLLHTSTAQRYHNPNSPPGCDPTGPTPRRDALSESWWSLVNWDYAEELYEEYDQ